MALIQINAVPEGREPEWVRKAWVSWNLPTLGDKPIFTGFKLLAGVLTVSKDILPIDQYHWVVLQEAGMQILRQNEFIAYLWYLFNGYPRSRSAQFLFGESICCQIGD